MVGAEVLVGTRTNQTFPTLFTVVNRGLPAIIIAIPKVFNSILQYRTVWVGRRAGILPAAGCSSARRPPLKKTHSVSTPPPSKLPHAPAVSEVPCFLSQPSAPAGAGAGRHAPKKPGWICCILCIGLRTLGFIIYGHITLTAPYPVRSAKLSRVKLG